MLENRTEAKVVIQHVSEVDDVSRGTNAVTSSNVYVVIAAHILVQRFSERTVWYGKAIASSLTSMHRCASSFYSHRTIFSKRLH